MISAILSAYMHGPPETMLPARAGRANDPADDYHRLVLRGSKASRTASPMKVSSDSMMARLKKAVKPSHGACRLFLPCSSNSPSDGEPGGKPSPRKSRLVSAVIEEVRMNGMKVMVATI